MITKTLKKLRITQEEAVADETRAERVSGESNPALKRAADEALRALMEIQKEIPENVQRVQVRNQQLAQAANALGGGR